MPASPHFSYQRHKDRAWQPVRILPLQFVLVAQICSKPFMASFGSGVSGSQPPDEPQPSNATISLDLTAEFESLFDSETLSDVTLIIPRSTGGAGSDERSERRFCLHKVILASSVVP